MNACWNLDPIYRGFDDPAWEADLTALKETAAAYSEFAESLSSQEPLAGLQRGIELGERLAALVNKLATYASLRQSADSRDSVAGSQMGRILGVYSGVAGPDAAFRDWAAKLPQLTELVAGDDSLREYRFLFGKMKANL